MDLTIDCVLSELTVAVGRIYIAGQSAGELRLSNDGVLETLQRLETRFV